jgi:hypothetical protein
LLLLFIFSFSFLLSRESDILFSFLFLLFLSFLFLFFTQTKHIESYKEIEKGGRLLFPFSVDTHSRPTRRNRGKERILKASTSQNWEVERERESLCLYFSLVGRVGSVERGRVLLFCWACFLLLAKRETKKKKGEGRARDGEGPFPTLLYWTERDKRGGGLQFSGLLLVSVWWSNRKRTSL